MSGVVGADDVVLISRHLVAGPFPRRGLLPIVVEPAVHAKLMAAPGAEVTVSLEDQTLALPDGTKVKFSVDPFSRYCLLNGMDEMDFLLSQDAAISAFEAGRR